MENISEKLILDMCKLLRISNVAFNDEVTDLILAAKADLLIGGILADKVNDESDPLIKRAVSTYVKAEFGLDNSDMEKYRQAYQNLKQHLMLSSEYISEE